MPWGYYVGLMALSELIALAGLLTLSWSLLGGNERRRQTRSPLSSVKSGAAVPYMPECGLNDGLPRPAYCEQ